MSAFHLTNLFLFSRHHIPTNSVAPFSAYKPTHNPQFLQSLWRRANARNVSFFFPLRWPIYVFNSVVNTELPIFASFSCFFSFSFRSLFCGVGKRIEMSLESRKSLLSFGCECNQRTAFAPSCNRSLYTQTRKTTRSGERFLKLDEGA